MYQKREWLISYYKYRFARQMDIEIAQHKVDEIGWISMVWWYLTVKKCIFLGGGSTWVKRASPKWQ